MERDDSRLPHGLLQLLPVRNRRVFYVRFRPGEIARDFKRQCKKREKTVQWRALV